MAANPISEVTPPLFRKIPVILNRGRVGPTWRTLGYRIAPSLSHLHEAISASDYDWLLPESVSGPEMFFWPSVGRGAIVLFRNTARSTLPTNVQRQSVNKRPIMYLHVASSTYICTIPVFPPWSGRTMHGELGL